MADGTVRCIDSEIPFDIPDSWAWVRMGTIGTWGAGATPIKGNPNYYGGNILWLRTGELNDGVVYDTEIKITDLALKECSLRMNKIGDVLIAMYGATIGKVAIVGKEMTTNQACCGCTPILTSNLYLFYFLMASKDDFTKKGEGGAQPNISREKLVGHLMPLPPINEQERIVQQIQKILPSILLYSRLKQELDIVNKNVITALRKSILQEAIQGRLVPQFPTEGKAEELLTEIRNEKVRLVKEGKLKKSAIANESRIFRGEDNRYYLKNGTETNCIDDCLFDIPTSWEWITLGELIVDTTGLSYKKESLTDRSEPFIRVLRGGNIEDGIMKFRDDDVFISSKYVPSNLFLTKGIYISPAVSSLEKIGKTAIVDRNYTDTVVGGFVLMLTPTFKDSELGRYLYYFFQSGFYQNYCRKITKKSGQAFYNLSRKKLVLCPVPIPPKAELKRILSTLDKMVAGIMSR